MIYRAYRGLCIIAFSVMAEVFIVNKATSMGFYSGESILFVLLWYLSILAIGTIVYAIFLPYNKTVALSSGITATLGCTIFYYFFMLKLLAA